MHRGELGRLIRFGLTGLAVTAVYVLCFTLMVHAGFWEFTANLAAFSAAVLFQYVAQTLYTFRQTLNDRHQIARFAAAIGVGLVYSTLVSTFVGPHFQWPTWVTATVLAVTWPIVNYIAFRFWVYRIEAPKETR